MQIEPKAIFFKLILSILIVCSTAGLKWLLLMLIGDPGPPGLLLGASILIAAYFSGPFTGILVTGAGLIIGEVFPLFHYQFPPFYDAVYFAEGCFVSFLVTQIRKSQKSSENTLKRQDEFISIVSHDLRSPLTSILLLIQRMLNNYPNETDLKRIEKGIHRMDRMLNILLDLSRINAGKVLLDLERLDLCDIIHGVIEQLTPNQSIKISLSCDKMIGWWDRTRLEQILTNLIGNAVKYGKNNPIEIKVISAEDIIKIFIKDHGIGISEQELPFIFERFMRSASVKDIKGSGLGLWITKQLVLLMQGNIIVRSQLNKGTTFIVELPIRPYKRN